MFIISHLFFSAAEMARKKKNNKVGKQNAAKDSNSGECSTSAAQQRDDTPSQMEVDDQIRNMSVESNLELTSDKEIWHQGEATVPFVPRARGRPLLAGGKLSLVV